ncbi:GNAT family N-acetyltransferase [Antarcticibacterium flavum]|uniref:GNAT family N-acetyltransferase n=1 Tax=Antarcticibacterium flavum TaxID=2058175 RepID=A0A5B7WZX6_9FLAO|nr:MULTISPECIES: GNAT family N-acetyltransferase [Antarcticibacterium]MCM4158768.1 hypothetical protein [Antarcticibacterium sp. W02-3]QCY68619.1 GNAT family N-acetyltransferase [Antarcticibacterium flavum]
MQIREAKQNDIPQILEVLKASLGETSSKKTEEIWRYKHIENPFGESLVLVAVEAGIIIGVRAFMRWKWQKGDEIFSTFRAVDTATHPDYQGKGIFKKLTLKALEIGKERGDHFVFNTPNAQSKPGYLKMGWEEVEKLKITIRPLNFFGANQGYRFQNKEEVESCVKLLAQQNKQNSQKKTLFTPKNIEYLNWRYFINPIQKYSIIANEDFFIAGYSKDRGRIKEFRIVEAMYDDIGEKNIKKAILELSDQSGAHFLSISPNADISFKIGVTRNFGPVLTFKAINYTEDNLPNIKLWNYSLGDMELF